MYKSICPQSTAKVFYVADFDLIELLKSKTSVYICQHAAEVSKSKTWAQYICPKVEFVEKLFINRATKKAKGVLVAVQKPQLQILVSQHFGISGKRENDISCLKFYLF